MEIKNAKDLKKEANDIWITARVGYLTKKMEQTLAVDKNAVSCAVDIELSDEVKKLFEEKGYKFITDKVPKQVKSPDGKVVNYEEDVLKISW